MEAEVASETEEGEDRRLRRKDDGTDARDGRRRVKDMQIDTDDPQAIARAAALAERQQFEQAVQELRQALETTPELEDFKQRLVVDQTSEGLRIPFVDQDKVAMFPRGSSQLYPQALELPRQVALTVDRLPHSISFVDPTDSHPFPNDRDY